MVSFYDSAGNSGYHPQSTLVSSHCSLCSLFLEVPGDMRGCFVSTAFGDAASTGQRAR